MQIYYSDRPGKTHIDQMDFCIFLPSHKVIRRADWDISVRPGIRVILAVNIVAPTQNMLNCPRCWRKISANEVRHIQW